MNSAVAQYVPFFLAVIAVGLGVIYSNSRITDIKDLIKSEVGGVRNEISSLRNELSRVETSIRGDIARLDQRLERLEQARVMRPTFRRRPS